MMSYSVKGNDFQSPARRLRVNLSIDMEATTFGHMGTWGFMQFFRKVTLLNQENHCTKYGNTSDCCTVPCHYAQNMEMLLIVVLYLVIHAEAQEAVTPGADVVDKTSGKKVGKVTTVLGPRGLGLIRLDSASKGGELRIGSQEDIHVKAVRPKWWPSDWGREDEGQAASNA